MTVHQTLENTEEKNAFIWRDANCEASTDDEQWSCVLFKQVHHVSSDFDSGKGQLQQLWVTSPWDITSYSCFTQQADFWSSNNLKDALTIVMALKKIYRDIPVTCGV